MKYDATLKKLFHNPPHRLLSRVLGKEITVERILPTELITVANLHPDVLFETTDGTLIHTELQGYPQPDFPARNLLYLALVLRDYGRIPVQVVFWVGPGKTGVGSGLKHPPVLDYKYQVVDVAREIDGDWLLDKGEVDESIFAILCHLRDQREAVVKILGRISTLPLPRQREAVAELLILSGLRGLKTLVNEEIVRMPISIDIHENEFLEEIYQEGMGKGMERGMEKGKEKGMAELLADLLTQRFGQLSPATHARIAQADAAELRRWAHRLGNASTIQAVLE